MSNYKHGDWYCKPANKSEAREIIERAVASGAVDEMDWEPDTAPFGVIDGEVSWDETTGTEYTIEQVREKFPLPSEQASVESKSSYAKQQYPLGAPVEVRMNGLWHQAVVHGQAGDYIIARADGYWYDEYTVEDVRPIRTERERFVDDAISAVGGKQAVISAESVFGKIYDAIKSGELKMPEVK